MGTEAKTGQSTDTVKENVLSPVLVEKILQIPTLDKHKGISIIDVGTGDASYSRHVINKLVDKGVFIDNLALIDADTEIFPDLLTTTLTSDMPPSINIQVVETKARSVVREFLRRYDEQYDVAISQLVLHQISDDSEMSHLINTTRRALKPDGTLLLVDLHPKFIRFLIEDEPTKFKVHDREGGLKGEYHFDSGGSVAMRSREITPLLSVMLGLGFDFTEVTPILPDTITNNKERYRKLTEREIPMFYIMQLRKNVNNFVSSTEGVVKQIAPHQEDLVSVTLADKDEVIIPNFRNLQKAKPGDHLELLEIHRPENNVRVLNCWIISEHSDQKVREVNWNQKIFSVDKGRSS